MNEAYSQRHDGIPPEGAEQPLSITRLLRTLAAYRAVILLTLLVVAVGYMIFAVAIYLLRPSIRTTSLHFRLDFEGAELGEYPNGVQFSTADIISTPILNSVFQQNHLNRFTDVGSFVQAVTVLAANPEYESLAADYRARLSDPRLSAVDRDHIEREWEAKRASLSKNEYEIAYLRHRGTDMPETLARKVLSDILQTWARTAAREQHVLEYRTPVLSPSIVEPIANERANLLAATQILRARIVNVMENVEQLRKVPGSELLRSSKQQLSLQEIRLRLEDLIRFQLDPLVRATRGAELYGDRDAAREFLEAQLQYDQRKLGAYQTAIENLRNAMAMYTSTQSSPDRAEQTTTTGGSQGTTVIQPQTEAVMPQLSDTFMERLVDLANRSSDLPYRQRIVDEYRKISGDIIPIQLAVSYDQELLQALSAGTGGGVDANTTLRAIDGIRNDTRALVVEVADIHSTLSRNRNPATELFTTTAPPTTVTERTVDVSRMILLGILVVLITLPLAIIGALLHHSFIAEENLEHAQ